MIRCLGTSFVSCYIIREYKTKSAYLSGNFTTWFLGGTRLESRTGTGLLSFHGYPVIRLEIIQCRHLYV